MTEFPNHLAMRERRRQHAAHRACPVCREPAAPGCKTCNRRACVKSLRAHVVVKLVGGQRPAAIDLGSRGPAYHSCGDLLVFGTDDGRAVEICPRCQCVEYTRADPQRWTLAR